MRIKVFVVLAAAIAALVVSPPGSAAAISHPAAAAHVGHLVPADQPRSRATGGGGRSHDFTGDGIPDILARTGSGNLVVWQHSGNYGGGRTYPTGTLVNTGWGAMTWVASADLSGDGWSDVVAVDGAGRMWMAVHSGVFNGTATLLGGLTLINQNWQINDLVSTFDVDGDGFDDLLARRAGTGSTYVYHNNGGVDGTATLRAPQLFVTGGASDVYQGMADMTLDGNPDLVFVQSNGIMGVHSFVNGTYTIGYGWQGIDRVLLTEANLDGLPDVLGRRASDGSLHAYSHTGRWTPAPDRTAYSTLNAPAWLGDGWSIYNVLT